MKTLMACCSLRGMQAKVKLARSMSPLFNTKTYANNMEVLFQRMWAQYERNGTPTQLTSYSSSRSLQTPNGHAVWIVRVPKEKGLFQLVLSSTLAKTELLYVLVWKNEESIFAIMRHFGTIFDSTLEVLNFEFSCSWRYSQACQCKNQKIHPCLTVTVYGSNQNFFPCTMF